MRSGFSFIKNGELLGYPYQEALISLAPLVDELVVAHGDSQDETAQRLEALRPRLACPLRVIDSPWDAQSQSGGHELARQTNIALDHCRHNLCVYIQGDEVLHEKELGLFQEDLERFTHDDEVEALAFRWIHFYGNFQTVVESRTWYRREIRALKKSSGLRSYADAQGFRIPQDQGNWCKARAALSRAHYYHYGWVRPPQTMALKSENFERLWHGNKRDGRHQPHNVYPATFGMRPFAGTHPEVMKSRLKALDGFDPFVGQALPQGPKYWKLWSSALWERWTGQRLGEFKNYRSLKYY